MSENKAKICPLLSSAALGELHECDQDHCAWFHLEHRPDGGFTDGARAMVRIADRLGSAGR